MDEQALMDFSLKLDHILIYYKNTCAINLTKNLI
jgi:hypothetical protein